MLFHIIAVIAATSSEPERYFANGPAPLIDSAMHIGHSTRRAINTDLNAGAVRTIRINQQSLKGGETEVVLHLRSWREALAFSDAFDL